MEMTSSPVAVCIVMLAYMNDDPSEAISDGVWSRRKRLTAGITPYELFIISEIKIS